MDERFRESVRTADGSLADLDELRPLWLELHHHHQQLMPEQAPFVDDAASWAARCALYQQLLAKPDTVLLLAKAANVLIGYGLAHVMPAGDTWVSDTWVTGSRIGEIESLGVTVERRGHGIGTALLHQLIDRMTDLGVDDLVLGVVPGNAAVNLYRRAGFRLSWTYLTRFTNSDSRQT